MKTPEEIKNGLDCCIKYMACYEREECCDLCPYQGMCSHLEKDAIDIIQQLEAENAKLKRERDAAKRDMELLVSEHYGPCEICNEAYCEDCNAYFSSFEWRGPCKENGCSEP